jgi:tRNA (uracil-5-)-methyltransferase TRM9
VDAATRDRLLELNRTFYSVHAARFSATRRRPWKGWDRVLARLGGAAGRTILDLGCGNGRLADACDRHFEPGSWSYTGVDASGALRSEAVARLARLRPAGFEIVAGDLLDAATSFWSRGLYDLVAVFGVMHHVPGAAARRDLLRAAAGRVAPGGRLAVSFWQWARSPSLAARAVAAAAAGLREADLEPGDRLLRWGDEASVLRYCHDCPPLEAAALMADLELAPVESFHADGRDRALNLYHLAARPVSGIRE